MDASLPARVAAAVLTVPPGLDERGLQDALRQRFDGLRLVVCNDEQVPPRARPAAENDRCRLYYLANGDHCIALGHDAESACGLLIGMVPDDAEH